MFEDLLDKIDWQPLPTPAADMADDLPYATHDGLLKIGEITLRCYQLSDGRRIIDAGESEPRTFSESPQLNITGGLKSEDYIRRMRDAR